MEMATKFTIRLDAVHSVTIGLKCVQRIVSKCDGGMRMAM